MNNFHNILIDMKNNKASKEEIEEIKNIVTILINKDLNNNLYKSLRDIDYNNVTICDINKIEALFNDWRIIGKSLDGIIPVNFANIKNNKVKCNFCNQIINKNYPNKLSSIFYKSEKMYIYLCDDCMEKLNPIGNIGEKETSYEEALEFLDDARNYIDEYKKSNIYKLIKTCMENNYTILKNKAPDKLNEYIRMLIPYNTALFNYFYALDHDKLTPEMINNLKFYCNKTYEWSSMMNNEKIITFIPQISNLYTNRQTYMGKFKIALNCIQSGRINDENYYTICKKTYDLLENSFSYEREYTIGSKNGIGAWIKDNRIIGEKKIPREMDMFALILTVLNDIENLLPYIKFYVNNVTGPKLVNYLKDYITLLYDQCRLNNDEYSEFGKVLKNSLNIIKDIKDTKEYIESEENNDSKRKQLKNLRHHKRSAYMG